jgi:23S rRNA (guanosine2251-2'-O)-methyltransferase
MRRIYGRHVVEELLQTSPKSLAAVWLLEGTSEAETQWVRTLAQAAGIDVRIASRQALRERSGGRGGANIAADIHVATCGDPEALLEGDGVPLLVALDGVTDPHNLGAILRSAAAYGVRGILTTRDRSAPLNDAAVRASAGAAAFVPVVRVTNLSRTLRGLKARGVWVIGTEADATTTAWDADLTVPSVLVVGAEGKGIRPGVARACDLMVRLPMVGEIGSLNVSVAAAVLLAESCRQRHLASV